MKARKHFDGWSLLVIAITLILFVAALFAKGLTHDLLLEAGVFLVSVKLILMGYKNSITSDSIQDKLSEIHSSVQQLEKDFKPERKPDSPAPHRNTASTSGK
jgi:hypothetical protein